MARYQKPRLLAAVAVLSASCGAASSTAPTPAAMTVLSVELASPLTTIGQSVQVSAVLVTSTSQKTNVTSQAVWHSSNPLVVSITSTGLATAISGGTSTISASYDAQTGSAPVNIDSDLYADCPGYLDDTLQIIQQPIGGWLLTDGMQRMAVLDTATDAANAVALARRHTAQCWIGRDNHRANRAQYVVEYWAGSTGVQTTISPEDCRPYIAANLRIVALGAAGWAVVDGVTQVMLLDSQMDANTALMLAKQFSSQCFIGRNTQLDPAAFAIEYWK